MYKTVIDLITSHLASTMPDAASQVDIARSATGDSALWSGPALSGEPLRLVLQDLAGSIVTASATALLAATMLVAVFVFAYRGRMGLAVTSVGFAVMLGLVSSMAGFVAHTRYVTIASWASEAASITPAQVVIASNNSRTSYPTSALSSVSMGRDRSVYLRFGFLQSVSLAPGEADYGTLNAVADRLAQEVPPRTPATRG